MNSDIKLSVSIITYNQKNYIRHAVDSVLNQKTNFNYEIIIGDDNSTDGTREILIEYKNKYPDTINLILHPSKNSGIPGKKNFISTIYTAKGEYIALLDGDDYWTDTNKLQKQVDFLDVNPEFAICFHNTKIIYEDGRPSVLWDSLYNFKFKETSTIEDLAFGNFINTPSCVFRNGLFKTFPAWFDDCYAGDYIVHLLNAQYGKIKYFNEVMANYRVHKGGVWESKDAIFRLTSLLKIQDIIVDKFGKKTGKIINNARLNNVEMLIYNDSPKGLSYLKRYLSYLLYKKSISYHNFIIMLKIFYFYTRHLIINK